MRLFFSIPSSTLTTMMWNLFRQNDHNEVSTKSSKPPSWYSWLREFQLKVTFGIFLPSVLAVSHTHIYSSKMNMTNFEFKQSATWPKSTNYRAKMLHHIFWRLLECDVANEPYGRVRKKDSFARNIAWVWSSESKRTTALQNFNLCKMY